MIEIHLYGELTDIVGKDRFTIENCESVFGCIEHLSNEFPKLKDKIYRVALNNELTDDDLSVKSGDILVLMPPFAGG